MPYIVKSKRDTLDQSINDLLDKIRELESDDPSTDVGGCLNYIFTRMLNRCYTDKYSEMAQAVSVLEMCKLEYYRKVCAPYESQKEFENGEVH